MNFDCIELTKDEYNWLCQLAEAPSGLHSGPHEKNLMEYHFITRNWYHVQTEDGDYKLEPISAIDRKGEEYLVYRKHEEKKERKETIRFLWSTGLAILALIIAIISLVIDLTL